MPTYATLISDKAGLDAFVPLSRNVDLEAGKPSDPTAPNSDDPPLTFIVNLVVQGHDDDAKHVEPQQHDLEPATLTNSAKAEEVHATEPISAVQSSLAVDVQSTEASLSSVVDQAESQSSATPVEVTCPPGLQETQPQPSMGAIEKAPEIAIPSVAVDPAPVNNAPSVDPNVPNVPEPDPFIPDAIFSISLDIFKSHNPALYSLDDTQPLDTFIPDSLFPAELRVHDPYHLTYAYPLVRVQHLQDAPVRYVRIFPKPSSTATDADVSTPDGGRVAHLYLHRDNRLGVGNHSTVFRAPLELRLDPSSRARSRVSVAVKLADRECGAHGMLWQEARMYNAFPKDFMEDTVRVVDVPRENNSTGASESEEVGAPEPSDADLCEAAEAPQSAETLGSPCSSVDDSVKTANVRQKDVEKCCSGATVGALDSDKDADAPAQAQQVQPKSSIPCDAGEEQPVTLDETLQNGFVCSTADSPCTEGKETNSHDDPPSTSTSTNATPSTTKRTESYPATVPKFFGFYAPVLKNGEVFTDTHERTCGREDDARCRVDWPTPILLVEECGRPISPDYYGGEQRYAVNVTPTCQPRY
ncbi:hypothetical protein BN946_scf184601.g11 [Trametes cinnabarina]|uniref:Uncharacterized protein n=1 Tax=Pycnoporus cinnabarinus TaxID=5643 RepID=A0A060SCE0_PYCCI|nr:hypothetical protein BN946_scf184601.g11 [Trametes cinnabarina]